MADLSGLIQFIEKGTALGIGPAAAAIKTGMTPQEIEAGIVVMRVAADFITKLADALAPVPVPVV